MKYIKNIKLSLFVGLLLHGSIGFAYGSEEQGQAILKNLNKFDRTPVPKLIEAARGGNIEEVKRALTNPETNINEVDKHDSTALMYATESGHKDMVELLLDKGADPHIITWNDKTALRAAVTQGHTELIKLLLNTPSTFRERSMSAALVEAAQKGDKESVHVLLDNGANPHSTAWTHPSDSFPTESTPLIEAARAGHTDIVRLLLDKGADPNMQDSSHGLTALMIAVCYGYKDIVKSLLDKSANPHIQDVHGNTALQIATRKGYKEIVQLLNNR